MQQVMNLPTDNKDQIYVTVQIEGSPCKMHLDTIILAKTLRQLCPTKVPPLRSAPFALWDFQKNAIAFKGVRKFWVKFKTHTQKLDLFVTEGPFTSLLGMSWFQPLGIGVTGINTTSTTAPDYTEVCAEFPAAFDRQQPPGHAAARPLGSPHLHQGPPGALRPQTQDEELD